MGKGVTKRDKQRRRLKKWAPVLRELERRMGGSLKNMDDVIRVSTNGRRLSAGERSQLLSMLQQYVKEGPHGFEIIPTKLKGALSMLPPEAIVEPDTDETPGDEPADLPEGDTAVTPPPAGPAPKSPTRILKISTEEATAMVNLCPDGALPELLPRGAMSSLGRDLGQIFRADGLVTSEGMGRGAKTYPIASSFDEIIFTIDDSRQGKERRWSRIPDDLQKPRAKDGWLHDLKHQLEKKTVAGSAPTAAPPPPKPAASTTELDGALRILEERLKACEETVKTAEEAARPFLAALETAKTAREEALKGIAAVRKLAGLPVQ